MVEAAAGMTSFSASDIVNSFLGHREGWFADMCACYPIGSSDDIGEGPDEEAEAALDRLTARIRWKIYEDKVKEALKVQADHEGKEVQTIKFEVLRKGLVLAMHTMSHQQRLRFGSDLWVRDRRTAEIAEFIPDKLLATPRNSKIYWARLRNTAIEEAESILLEDGISEDIFEDFETHPDQSHDPLAILLAQAEQDSLQRAWQQLHPDDQQILIRSEEGYTDTELATLLEIKPDAARQRLQRARKRLRRNMEPD